MSFPDAKQARNITESRQLIKSEHGNSAVPHALNDCKANVLLQMYSGGSSHYCSPLDEVGVNFFKSKGFKAEQVDCRDFFFDFKGTRISW